MFSPNFSTSATLRDPAQEQQRLSPAERANLVAYLDGELNEAESVAIANKLSNSVSVRREIEMLQKTWQMLEILERPQVDEDFKSRTLTEARLQPHLEDRWLTPLTHGTQYVVGVLFRLAILAAVAGLGYAATALLWPDPSQRLIQDLGIAEHLDAYQAVGNFEFLSELERRPEFNPPSK